MTGSAMIEHLYEGGTLTPADLDVDPDELRLAGLIAQVRQEADAIEQLIPAATAAQWTKAPVARPAEDTAERSRGVPADPTADTVLDTDRVYLREQVLRSERVIRVMIAALRRARADLERGLAPWTGDAD